MIDIGQHDAIPADDYHSDPSLSSGIAKLLIDRSPAHAWTAHPTLNPNWEREVEDKFDLGTAAHRLLLEGEDCMAIWDGKQEWRTAEAKEFKAEARAAGKVPVLIAQAERVRAMVELAKMQFAHYEPDLRLFRGGKPEVTIRWEDDHGVHCRARIDWLHDETYAIDDFKSTSASSDPRKWSKTGFGMGIDVQACFYRRGIEHLTGITPPFRFVVQETYPPYALSVVDLAPSALALGDAKVQRAIDLWAKCMEEDFWPVYGTQVASLEALPWAEADWLDRQEETQ